MTNTNNPISPDALEGSLTLQSCASALLKARAIHELLPSTPFPNGPETTEEAYAIQRKVALALTGTLGLVCGWKVGAPSPTAEPSCAPLHAATIFKGETTLPQNMCHFYGIEAEIVYRIGKNLPPQNTLWSHEDALNAIESVHPGIEIFDTRFGAVGSQTPFLHLADQGNHGALIYGDAMTNWASLNPVEEPVQLTIDDTIVAEHDGGNSAGDPIRMLIWLAQHAEKQGFPLKEGDIITTGSTTGTIFADSGSKAKAVFASLGGIKVNLP
ncbi:2-oxopent-4-enoate hydratase [Neokomagataea thailandica NBRC 106555]|uniref:2-keto-4-pentenoate hydratase n=2 Tax=Neokomagataea TaxID=1223423 RepID=A0A4Y6V5X1_9PROT|nr:MULTISPECIES: fumarylacetoacetate hydrolase family protein [Neokomagataea]QDH25459.1 2-keto-4-pentenoate hydratase [Neokomagataea tanensis]GBR51173.1 2-oxopent-4-enoate hydratase [Neokomagataea thailandica NBRC 106555]